MKGVKESRGRARRKGAREIARGGGRERIGKKTELSTSISNSVT